MASFGRAEPRTGPGSTASGLMVPAAHDDDAGAYLDPTEVHSPEMDLAGICSERTRFIGARSAGLAFSRRSPVAFDELPEFLTVEEAAAVLRIGRTSAYQLSQRWRFSQGESGLPVVQVGRQLRVPRAALVRLAESGASS